MLDEYAIDKSMVTCFTTDTAANLKKAIRLLRVPWQACANHVFELSFGVVASHANIKGVRCFVSNNTRLCCGTAVWVPMLCRQTTVCVQKTTPEYFCVKHCRRKCTYYMMCCCTTHCFYRLRRTANFAIGARYQCSLHVPL